jgi:hypothetical protein
MRQFMMTVMAPAVFEAIVVTAQAEIGGGGPMRNGDQCFKYGAGNYEDKDGRFGSWGPSPQPRSRLTRQKISTFGTISVSPLMALLKRMISIVETDSGFCNRLQTMYGLGAPL